MQITFKLYASLTQHLPAESRRSNQIPLEVADGTPIAKIIEPFGMPEKLVHLVLVNGVYVPPAERLSFVPKNGDVLAIWPPIAGGQGLFKLKQALGVQAVYPLAFVREMGCTEAELRAWLPGAGGGRPIAWREQGADIALDRGSVSIGWRTREPRRIAQITVPRLEVHFDARGVDGAAWQRFMRHFDLYTQRGGG